MTARRPLVLVTGRQNELPSGDTIAGYEPAITAGVAGHFWQGNKTWTYPHFAPGGRLTLTSGTPITTANVTGAGTLYYTPYLHDGIRLYDGTRIKQYEFTERSLSLSLTADKIYDVFLYDNSGTLTLELSQQWTDNTTRADALAWQNGLGGIKSGSATHLWLGTIRASGTNVTADSTAARFLSNAYNRVRKSLLRSDSTDNSYTTASWRYFNNDSTMKVEWVQALPAFVTMQAWGKADALSGGVIGYDIDAATAADNSEQIQFNPGTGAFLTASPTKCIPLAAGYHYASALQLGAANMDFYDEGLNGALEC